MPVIMHFFRHSVLLCTLFSMRSKPRATATKYEGERGKDLRTSERGRIFFSKKSKRKWQINWHSEYHQHCTPNRFVNLLLLLLRLLLYVNGWILASKYTSAKSLLAKLLYERPLCHRRLKLQTYFEPHTHRMYLHFLHPSLSLLAHILSLSPWSYVRQAWLGRKCARLCVRRLVRSKKCITNYVKEKFYWFSGK